MRLMSSCHSTSTVHKNIGNMWDWHVVHHLPLSYVILLWYAFYLIILAIFRCWAINNPSAFPDVSYGIENHWLLPCLQPSAIAGSCTPDPFTQVRAPPHTINIHQTFPAIVTPPSSIFPNLLAAPASTTITTRDTTTRDTGHAIWKITRVWGRVFCFTFHIYSHRLYSSCVHVRLVTMSQSAQHLRNYHYNVK